MIVCGVVDIILDVLACFAIDGIDRIPVWLCTGLNLAFYVVQSAMPMLMMSFIATLCRTFTRERIRRYWYLFAPYVGILLLIATNPIHHLFFRVSQVGTKLVCSGGIGTYLIYMCCCFYLAASYVIAYKHRLVLDIRQYNTIAISIFTIAIVILLQNIAPSYLLTGMGMTICILIMSLTMQDPADMLDYATMMFNYRAMERFLTNYSTYKGTMYMVAVDICNYHNIKASLGLRLFGRVMRELGHFFNAIVYGSGWAFRMSDGRFLLVTFDQREYLSLRNTIRYRFARPWEIEDRSAMFSATLCCSEHKDFSDPQKIISVIDLALDELDDDRRGTEFDIDSGCLERGIRRTEIEKAMRTALLSGEGFFLNFQPIYDLKTEKFNSAEVLLRLKNKDLGLISPGEFIPIAISSGLMRDIDAMVVTMTCDFMSRNPQLKALGIERLAINLSSPEYFSEAAASIKSIVDKYGIDPRQLLFEMTETITLSNYAASEDMMHKMKKEGYTFSLDDFGTGYANILGLKSLPFNCVKLDRFLVSSEDRPGKILFEEMIRMLLRMDVEVLVEGVETKEQLERTISSGTRFIQGFYYSRPLGDDAFISFLEKNN